MKKILTLAFLLFCMTAVAQNRPTFIIQGGYQGSNVLNGKDLNMLHGFRAGAAVDYAFVTSDTYELSLQTGLNYSMKGYWGKVRIATVGDLKVIARLHYVDLPVLLNSRFKLSDNFNAFVNFGPYFAYGLSGKKIVEFKSGEKETAKENLFREYEGKESKLHPFDFGAQVGAGIDVSRIMFGVGTQYGITKLFRDKDRNLKNISFYASVGYRF
ncbi:MAG: porin family protein [Porphyromonas sp.]|nr:porin family protein [Porphyromonas sp.]